MARYKNGINGAFSGKVGTVVGASWKGIPYMRSLPSERTSAVSKAEKTNRNKFAMAHRWLQPVLEFVREGFKGYSETVEGFLAAKSHLLKNAFEVNGEVVSINPALVKLSSGDLLLPGNIAVEKSGEWQIQFTWDATNIEFANRFDQVMVLAYDIENERAFCHVPGQTRVNGADVIMVSPVTGRSTYHLYMAFVAADRSSRSDSVYLGTMRF